MAPHIYLLRHGETEWSLSGRHTGRTDVSLTARGEDEARAAGRELQGIVFERVLTSPRSRAKRTAELAGFGGQAEVTDALMEWDYGDFEGLLVSEIRARQPGWNVFEHGCPGGESPQQVLNRADRLLASLRQINGNILLVCHGHFTRVIAMRWVEHPVAHGQMLDSNTGSISRLGVNRNEPWPVIHVWNRKPTL